MLETIIIALRAVQALFAIIVLGLTGHGKHPSPSYPSSSHPPPTISTNEKSPQLTKSPSQVASYGLTPSSDSFMVFASVWTLLILIYLGLAPRFFSAFAHPIAMLGLDALTMLFWFAGFIALAVFHHRAEEVYFGDGLGDYYKGCAAAGGLCGEIEAAAIFGAFEWWVGALALPFWQNWGLTAVFAKGPLRRHHRFTSTRIHAQPWWQVVQTCGGSLCIRRHYAGLDGFITVRPLGFGLDRQCTYKPPKAWYINNSPQPFSGLGRR